MKQWVQLVLKPYIEKAPEGVYPLLFLDSYRCHMMASIVNAIADLGVQVEHIPGGCTGLCQPIDVGIGKPIKNRVRNYWEDWMVEQPRGRPMVPPSRKTVAEWVNQAFRSLPKEMVRKSWRHGNYSYFPDEGVSE